MAKLLRIVLTGSAFLLFWWGGLLVSYVVLPIVRLRRPRTPSGQAARCRAAVARAFRLHVAYLRLCRLIEFDPRAVERSLPAGPFILVANHPTLIDVVLLASARPDLCLVVKGPLFRSPFVGRLLGLCGHIDAGDGGAGAGASVILQACGRLAEGHPVLVFPEGTRSPPGGLGPFHQGAFAMARASGASVVPVHVHVSPRGLMRGLPWYTVPDGPMRFTLTALAPLRVPPRTATLRALAAEVRLLFEQRVAGHATCAEAGALSAEPAGAAG